MTGVFIGRKCHGKAEKQRENTCAHRGETGVRHLLTEECQGL